MPTATLTPGGRAVASPSAPPAVKAMIEAANRIRHRPYHWGGGHRSWLEETVEQLLESSRRLSAVSGDRWFVAPAEAPASACCLISRGGVGQIEDVGTLAAARERGLGQAVVLAALAASRAQGNRTTFLTAAADDWPLLMYEKLGFAIRGELTTLRRLPT